MLSAVPHLDAATTRSMTGLKEWLTSLHAWIPAFAALASHGNDGLIAGWTAVNSLSEQELFRQV